MAIALRIVGAVGGLFALIIGIWGIVERDAGTEPAQISEGFLWLAIGLVSLAVAVLALALAKQRD